MNLKKYVYKDVKITLVRGIGASKFKKVHKGRLVEIQNSEICLEGNDGRYRWFKKPNYPHDNIEIIGGNE